MCTEATLTRLPETSIASLRRSRKTVRRMPPSEKSASNASEAVSRKSDSSISNGERTRLRPSSESFAANSACAIETGER